MTGPVGTFLSDAIRNPNSVSGQTEVLWTSGSGAGNLELKVGQVFHDSVEPDEAFHLLWCTIKRNDC